MTQLCRNSIKALLHDGFRLLKGTYPHPGLLLTKGLVEFPQGEKAGEIKARHIAEVANLPVSPHYGAAFERWKSATGDASRFASLQASLAGRLYIGLVRENALETGVTISHTYGMPMIPGSAAKGLCRAGAAEWLDNKEAMGWMFGNDPEETNEAKLESGGLIFHDAWWVPEGKPFVPETVTVHHGDYYGSKGETAATDFDSPVPASQIAVRGSFHFVVEGLPMWTKLAVRLLERGLKEYGIGAKRSSGYGFMTVERANAKTP